MQLETAFLTLLIQVETPCVAHGDHKDHSGGTTRITVAGVVQTPLARFSITIPSGCRSSLGGRPPREPSWGRQAPCLELSPLVCGDPALQVGPPEGPGWGGGVSLAQNRPNHSAGPIPQPSG